MKRIAYLLAIFGLGVTLRAQDESTGYSVFRICQDQRVIHTSDGADVGHVEYILVDPTQQRIVSTVITGGAIGDRYVAVPYEDVQFQGDSGDIVLNNIDRERIVSAPAIEVNQLTSSRRVDTSFVQPSVSYFGTSTERRTTGAETSTSTSINREQTAPGTNLEAGQPAAESSAQRTKRNRSAAEPSTQRARQNQPPPSPSEVATPSQERNPEARNSPQPTPGEPRSNASARHHHRQLNAEGGASGTPSASETPGSSGSGRHGASAEQGTPASEGQAGSTTRHHHHTTMTGEGSANGTSVQSPRASGTLPSDASQGSRSSESTQRAESGRSAHRRSGRSTASETPGSEGSSSSPESSSTSDHGAQGSSTP